MKRYDDHFWACARCQGAASFVESFLVPTYLFGTPQAKNRLSQGTAADDPRAKRPWRYRTMDVCQLQAQKVCGDSSARPAEYLPRLFQDGKMRPYEALASPRIKPSCREPRILQWFTHRGSWKQCRLSLYNTVVRPSVKNAIHQGEVKVSFNYCCSKSHLD